MLHDHYLIKYADGTFERRHLAIREDFKSDQIFDAFAALERQTGVKVAILIPIRPPPETQT